MSAQVAEEHIETIWHNHCRTAVRKFLMNAVVIDNQPVLEDRRNRAPGAGSFKVAQKHDDGMDAAETKEIAGQIQSSKGGGGAAEETADEDDDKKQDLNIRKISDVFASEQISCSFVFPKEGDKTEEKFDRIIAAAVPSDIVIIDWYLEKKDPVLTQNVLQKIAEKDKDEHGRMRLVCIYTGQTDTDQVTRDAVRALEKGGLQTDECKPENGTAQGRHHSLLVLNKQDVNCKELPDCILNAFTKLSDGILPSFALAAVAAVRRNMHHIITKFSKELDAAYVANRLITDPPGDVAELIRELFVSECDTALGLEKVADRYLETPQIDKWLTFHKQPKDDTCVLKNNGQSVDQEFINALQKNGIVDRKNVIISDEKRVKFSEEKRGLISQALHGGKDLSIQGEQDFARFVALKRESCGNTKIDSDEKWVPSLTLGTLLRHSHEGGEKFFYCLTPACDTLRLQGEERTFLLIELFEDKPKGDKSLIIVKDGGKNKSLFISPHPTNIRTFRFIGSEETGRVMAERFEKDERPQFTFTTSDGDPIELFWIGEVRKHRANRDMADLNRMWLRFGINDSEYLRLAGKGKAAM